VRLQSRWFVRWNQSLRRSPNSIVVSLGKEKGEKLLPDNSSIEPKFIVQYGNARRSDQVQEWVEK
jgi:hypothetical protein